MVVDRILLPLTHRLTIGKNALRRRTLAVWDRHSVGAIRYLSPVCLDGFGWGLGRIDLVAKTYPVRHLNRLDRSVPRLDLFQNGSPQMGPRGVRRILCCHPR